MSFIVTTKYFVLHTYIELNNRNSFVGVLDSFNWSLLLLIRDLNNINVWIGDISWEFIIKWVIFRWVLMKIQLVKNLLHFFHHTEVELYPFNFYFILFWSFNFWVFHYSFPYGTRDNIIGDSYSFKLMFFGVFRSFCCANIKNNFFKIKKLFWYITPKKLSLPNIP
jgi:hypothetical protein